MAVFRIEKTRDYTVMSNYHLRDMSLSLKAKGLLSLMLSLPENWDYTMKGLSRICKDGIDSISGGIRELEAHGYLIRARVRGANGQLGSIEYTILEQPIQNVACSLAISVSVLQKRNLILWNCFLKIQDRSLIKNGYMSVFGVMTARATAALWQSISAGYGLKLLHIPTIYMLKRFGGVDTNGSSKLPQALFISPKKPCSLYNCLCCTRSLSIRNDFFNLW